MSKEAYEAGIKLAAIDAGLVKESAATLGGVLGGLAGAGGGGVLGGLGGAAAHKLLDIDAETAVPIGALLGALAGGYGGGVGGYRLGEKLDKSEFGDKPLIPGTESMGAWRPRIRHLWGSPLDLLDPRPSTKQAMVLEKTSGPKAELARKLLPGAGYGALAGGGIGALTGEDPLTGALMGAGLGAGAGALGKHMFRQSDDVQRLARAAYVAKAGLRDRLKRMPGPETLSKGEMRLDVDSLKRALKGFGY